MKKITVLILSLLAVFLFTGCMCTAEKVTEKIIEQAAKSEGEDVDVDISGDQVKITDEEGQEVTISSDDKTTTISSEEGETTITVGEGLSLPEGFPSAVPVPSDLNIVSGTSYQESGKQFFMVTGTYGGGSAGDLDSWYKQNLSGWEIEHEQSTQVEGEGAFYSITANNGIYRVNVMSAESEGEVSLTMQVEEM